MLVVVLLCGLENFETSIVSDDIKSDDKAVLLRLLSGKIPLKCNKLVNVCTLQSKSEHIEFGEYKVNPNKYLESEAKNLIFKDCRSQKFQEKRDDEKPENELMCWEGECWNPEDNHLRIIIGMVSSLGTILNAI